MLGVVLFVFFFFKQKTAYEMRISDWSSDVCSSDLFWALAAGYFSPRRSWKPLATLALILFLTLCAVRLEVLFSNWYNTMYTALQKLDESGFWGAMLLFAVLATIHVARSLFDFYVQQAFTIRWRVWLNEKLLGNWLDKQAYYRSQYLDAPVDHPR